MVQDGDSILLFKVNGIIYHNVTNGNPRTYHDLDFYTSYGTYSTSDAHMRYFQFDSADSANDIPPLSTFKNGTQSILKLIFKFHITYGF